MKDHGVISYISLCGMLGYGYNIANLKKKISETEIDFMGVDAGSTDPGPYYLGSGKGFVKDAQTLRDLEPALILACKNNIPLIIGSAGGSGAKKHLDNTLTIIKSICSKHSLHFKMAAIYSDLKKSVALSALKNGRITPCSNVPQLTVDMIKDSRGLVAQMGTEPIVNALQNGANLVVAGRSCDTAIFASYPLIKGVEPGPALHAAKIAECGALCAVPAGANDSLYVELGKNSFVVEPLSGERKCDPSSVAAHSLYEQPQPHCFYEPEGMVDMSGSIFEQYGERSVKVSGTKLVKADNETIKLEGSRLAGYRSLAIAGTRDPMVIANIDLIQRQVAEKITETVEGIIAEDQYSLRFLRYGLDAVAFNGKTPAQAPREIGLLMEAVAPTQRDADLIISLARSTALHQGFPGRKTTAGNLAFPFSPSDLRAGPVYEFSVYHLMSVEKGYSEKLFKTVYEEL